MITMLTHFAVRYIHRTEFDTPNRALNNPKPARELAIKVISAHDRDVFLPFFCTTEI